MWRPHARATSVSAVAILVTAVAAADAAAQARRVTVYADAGFASIGHADSEQGTAPIVGGGAMLRLTRHLAIDGDVHGARVRHVFGRDHHDFTQVTMTGSLLFTTPVTQRSRVIAGAGVGRQRAHIQFETPPVGAVDRRETIRLLHGRIGTEWDVSDRFVVRALAVGWMGGGLDWVLGARAGIGYRF
jgi:hypothetical protein